MSIDTLPTQAEETPPSWFKYDPDLMLDYEEQVEHAIAFQKHQDAPIPSFEAVPELAIQPVFNPSGALGSEIYAHGRRPERTETGKKLRSEWTDNPEPVEIWRIVERDKLLDGTGIVSSQVLSTGNLGDIENYQDTAHYHSHHDQRLSSADSVTPYVSFSTDPEDLARIILKRGFGVKGGRDSVIVRALVEPDRIMTGPDAKEPEIVLIGGLAPDEYQAAYSVADFVDTIVSDEEITTVYGDTMTPARTLGHWALRG